MKYINKIASILGATALGMLAMTSCEGGDLYEIDSPDWIAQRADSIKNSKVPEKEEELEGMMEDVYTIGAPDFTTGWWAQFSKYYVISAGEKWNAQFNLNINPNASNTYKNFALILCSDAGRGEAGYVEYGAIRYDHQPSGNSEWGDYINRDNVESSLTFGSDTDAGVDKLGGKVTLTIDRTDSNNFIVKMSNGTVTKTYTHKHALENLNADEANTNIRAFLVPEGSCINFLATNIEPIGGCTSALDKQPISLTLQGVPEEVLLGSTIEEAMAKVTAVVEFEEGVTKNVKMEDLQIEAIPDMETLGAKTLIAIYNKTFKGENCEKPIVAYAQFAVVDEITPFTQKVVFPTPAVIGAEDNSTPWWTAFTENIKVEPKQTVYVSFTNYTNCVNNWNNFCVILNREDLSEYGVVRADNFGWGAGYDGNANLVTSMEEGRDWDAWRAAMDGAKVSLAISNNGDGTADIKAVMIGNDGNTYTQEYLGINGIDKKNLYFRFVCEGSHLVFDQPGEVVEVTPTPGTIGNEDNSTPWWSAFTDNVKIEPGKTVQVKFTNYSSCANNWNNFVVILNAENISKEYAVVRADNFGWGAGYDGNANLVTSMEEGRDWDAWRAAMDGAKVTLTITNNGDGTADIKAVMVGNDGNTYNQEYKGICSIVPTDLYFRFVCDGNHLVF